MLAVGIGATDDDDREIPARRRWRHSARGSGERARAEWMDLMEVKHETATAGFLPRVPSSWGEGGGGRGSWKLRGPGGSGRRLGRGQQQRSYSDVARGTLRPNVCQNCQRGTLYKEAASKEMVYEVIVGNPDSASLCLHGTGKRKRGEKTQPLHHF